MIEKLLDNCEELYNAEIIKILQDDNMSQENQLKIFFGTLKLQKAIFTRVGIDYEENFSYAWTACKRACEKFKDDGSAKFTTYLSWHLRSQASNINDKKNRKHGRLDIDYMDDDTAGMNWHEIIQNECNNLPFDTFPIDEQFEKIKEVAEKILTPHQKIVWNEYLKCNYRQVDVAEKLGMSKQNVNSLLKKSFERIKNHFEKI